MVTNFTVTLFSICKAEKRFKLIKKKKTFLKSQTAYLWIIKWTFSYLIQPQKYVALNRSLADQMKTNRLHWEDMIRTELMPDITFALFSDSQKATLHSTNNLLLHSCAEELIRLVLKICRVWITDCQFMESGNITSFRALEPVKVQFAIKQPITKQWERSRYCKILFPWWLLVHLMIVSTANKLPALF